MSIEAKPTAVSRSQWGTVLADNAVRQGAAVVFGKSRRAGDVYRWGMMVGQTAIEDRLLAVLSRMAAEVHVPKRLHREAELASAAQMQAEWLQTTRQVGIADAAVAVIWAAALPRLYGVLPAHDWSDLYHGLADFREQQRATVQADSPFNLMLGAELGLTLAWRCDGLPGSASYRASAVAALAAWIAADPQAVSSALREPDTMRLVLASLLRSRWLIKLTKQRRLAKPLRRLGYQVATWVAALARPDGSAALGRAGPQYGGHDDLTRDGLFDAAVQLHPAGLRAAFEAALGNGPARGRLAWQVALPETLLHDPVAKLAVATPDWDVRRGRTFVDYSAPEVCLEIWAGRRRIVRGPWETILEVDGQPQTPRGDWTEICESSDDDVHYLEFEQAWSADLLLQRQILLIRDDRCLLLADSILPRGDRGPLPASIRYVSRLPLDDGVQYLPEADTREAILGGPKPLALVVPLAASEWRIGPTAARLDLTGQDQLEYAVSGSCRLFAPLWLDFERRRFPRPRTWRSLTVADQLRPVDRAEAVGYRVQAGSQHWMIYRSLADRVCRSLLGKHLIAEFFASRFCPDRGEHEELLTVDDSEVDDG